MSSKERAMRQAAAIDRQRIAAEKEGMRQALESPDGRALISFITRAALEAEGPGSSQLRQFGRDILKAAQIANWDGVQIMREEYEKPGMRAEAEEEPEDEE